MRRSSSCLMAFLLGVSLVAGTPTAPVLAAGLAEDQIMVTSVESSKESMSENSQSGMEAWGKQEETEITVETVRLDGSEEEKVPLSSGTWEKWIDRLDLSEKPEVRQIYDILVEATDNDGTDDWLIEDKYFTGEHGIVVKQILEDHTLFQSEVVRCIQR